MGAAASSFVIFLESEIMSNRFEVFAHLANRRAAAMREGAPYRRI
jgi:hypothetical protein